MTWTVSFYNEKVKQQVLAFPTGILANFLHIVDLIEEFARTSANPIQKPWAEVFSKSGQKDRKVSVERFSAP